MVIYIFLISIDNQEQKENKGSEQDFKQWQAEWEDEEVNDNFNVILKEELKNSGMIKL